MLITNIISGVAVEANALKNYTVDDYFELVGRLFFFCLSICRSVFRLLLNFIYLFSASADCSIPR